MSEVEDGTDLTRVQHELEELVQRRLLGGMTALEEEHYKALLTLESRLLAEQRPRRSARR